MRRYNKELLQYLKNSADANSDAMSKAIALWENLLEQQENRDRQNQAECETQKVWLAEQTSRTRTSTKSNSNNLKSKCSLIQ